MLAAQLHGKLTRKEEDLEDLLTSNVFGTIKYVPYEDGLIPILSAAERVDGSNPFIDLTEISNAEYVFWPRLEEEDCNPCVPDVLIYITHTNGTKTIVLIESKFKSGKSSEADDTDRPNDQLAKEWDNLLIHGKNIKSEPFLLYITQDITFPKVDIESSQLDYLITRGSRIDILWLSWRRLSTILTSNELILEDLKSILRKQGFIFFEGVYIPSIVKIPWKFIGIQEKLHKKFVDWKLAFPDFDWRFIND